MTGATTNPWIATLEPLKLELALQKLRDEAANGSAGAVAAMRYAHGDEHFALYLVVCARRCQRICGLSIFDLADYEWREAFDCATPPGEAVREALMNDDTGSMFLGDLFGGE